MVITHHGGQCFKVTFGDLTMVFDPISKSSKLTTPSRFGADIALVSRNHPDTNGVSEVTYGEKTPFIISGPGEYERQGVTIQGFLSKSGFGLAKDETSAINTIYSVQLEDMTLVHLGALMDKELPAAARENIEDVDVLFVPIGGDGVLNPAQAHELVVALEPHIVIPMHYDNDKNALASFLKVSGSTGEKLEKLTLKKKDLAGKEGSILILES